MKIFSRPKRREFLRLRFYMKSGSSFLLDRVTHFDMAADGNTITQLKLEQHEDRTGTKLLIASIDLSQIEAVVREPR